MKRPLLLAVALLSPVVTLAATFMPLEVGNRWIYRDFETGNTFTVTVGTPIFIDGHVYFTLTGYASQKLYVRYNSYNNLVYRDEDRNMDVLLTSFEYVPRAWFNAPLRPCDQEGQVQEGRGSYVGVAGVFSGTLSINYKAGEGCADAQTTGEEYVENIGLVSRMVTHIDGPHIYDLVYARVARATLVDALPRGSFTVNFVRRPNDTALDVTLRIAAHPANPLTLRMPAARPFEIRVTDADGNVLWSTPSRALTLTPTDVVVTGNAEWTGTVPTTLPNGEKLTPQKHFISARLITYGPLQFATAVPYSFN